MTHRTLFAAALVAAVGSAAALPAAAQSEYVEEGSISCRTITQDLLPLDFQEIARTGQLPANASPRSVETFRLVQGFVAGFLSGYQLYRQDHAGAPVENALNGVAIIAEGCSNYPTQRLMDVLVTRYRDIIDGASETQTAEHPFAGLCNDPVLKSAVEQEFYAKLQAAGYDTNGQQTRDLLDALENLEPASDEITADTIDGVFRSLQTRDPTRNWAEVVSFEAVCTGPLDRSMSPQGRQESRNAWKAMGWKHPNTLIVSVMALTTNQEIYYVGMNGFFGPAEHGFQIDRWR